MSVSAAQRPPAAGLAPAFAAARARSGLIVVLFTVAGLGWWYAIDQMQGMDNGPWSSLGTLGWFLGAWVVMMAAMMLPSVAPTIALYSRMARARSWPAPLLFAGGYLLTWAGAGLLAFAVAVAGRAVAGNVLSWDHLGRWVAGGTLLVAAAYELTPLKDVCLGKCRSPLGSLLASWREGWSGPIRMGALNGAWCVGCCWALMLSLFALGIMSLPWMAFTAGLIALEKTLPWRRVATYGVTVALLLLGLWLLIDPAAIPGLTIPHAGSMHEMGMMGS